MGKVVEMTRKFVVEKINHALGALQLDLVAGPGKPGIVRLHAAALQEILKSIFLRYSASNPDHALESLLQALHATVLCVRLSFLSPAIDVPMELELSLTFQLVSLLDAELDTIAK